MSLKKVKPGDRLTIPATTFNAFVDAAEDFQRRQRDQGGSARQSFRQAGLILIKNNTGANLAQCAVVGVGNPVFGPTVNLDEFKNRLALLGVAPTASHTDGRFVVLLEPLAAGAIGLAWCAGICPVKVNITDAAHKAADISANVTANLVSAASGPAQILWSASATGNVWCVVKLGGGAGAPAGTVSSPVNLTGSGSTANAATWDINNPPPGTKGVIYQPFRLYWSGVAGESLFFFHRKPTFDSAGRLVAVSAEQGSAIGTGDCEL